MVRLASLSPETCSPKSAFTAPMPSVSTSMTEKSISTVASSGTGCASPRRAPVTPSSWLTEARAVGLASLA